MLSDTHLHDTKRAPDGDRAMQVTFSPCPVFLTSDPVSTIQTRSVLSSLPVATCDCEMKSTVMMQSKWPLSSWMTSRRGMLQIMAVAGFVDGPDTAECIMRDGEKIHETTATL